MTIYFVYVLTFSNGKVYIGMSKTCAKGLFTGRYRGHTRDAGKGKSLPIYHAWRKHGAPTQEIVSQHETRAECALAEIALIYKHDSTNINNGYNITGGGEGQDSATNPRLHAILREKVWGNPVWRKKVSDALKGRQPSQATKDAYAEFCKTPAKSECAKVAWQNPEYKAMKSETTRQQMANGGSEHMSKMFKGRQDPRSEEGKEAHRQKVKAYMNTPEGKAAARRGYDAFIAKPENIAANRSALDNWRASDKNKEQCKEMAKRSAEACSRKVIDSETGIIYDSQRAMAKALDVNEAYISRKVKAGKIKRV